MFPDDKRRKINLGGASSASSHAAILNQARAQRFERDKVRRQHESAVRIQAWWRGIRDTRALRRELQASFEQDVLGLSGLRCLVLIGSNDDLFGRWSGAIVCAGEGMSPRPSISTPPHCHPNRVISAPPYRPAEA